MGCALAANHLVQVWRQEKERVVAAQAQATRSAQARAAARVWRPAGAADEPRALARTRLPPTPAMGAAPARSAAGALLAHRSRRAGTEGAVSAEGGEDAERADGDASPEPYLAGAHQNRASPPALSPPSSVLRSFR